MNHDLEFTFFPFHFQFVNLNSKVQIKEQRISTDNIDIKWSEQSFMALEYLFLY